MIREPIMGLNEILPYYKGVTMKFSEFFKKYLLSGLICSAIQLAVLFGGLGLYGVYKTVKSRSLEIQDSESDESQE